MNKSFLAGVSLISVGCTIALLVHLLLTNGYIGSKRDHDDDHDDHDSSRPLPTRFDPLTSHLGIYSEAAVATDAGPCAEVGADVMKMDGTAVDAAIATLFCAGVVNFQSLGVGGGFIMNIYIRDSQQNHILMARETAPAAATRDMFVNTTVNESRYSGKSIAIPGEIRGYFEAKKKFGNSNITMEQLAQPAIDLAEQGVIVTRSHIKAFDLHAKRLLKTSPAWKDIFTDPVSGKLLKLGEKFKLPKLAKTLRAITANEDEFYEGDIAKQTVCDIKAAGGIITEEDLKNYKVHWDTPITNHLPNQKLNVFSAPPPSSGVITGAILGIMDQFNHTKEDFKNAVTFQRFVEACKFGFAKRTLLGDWNNPSMKETLKKLVNELSSQETAKSIRHQIRDNWTSKESVYYGAEFSQADDEGTSHTSIIAPNGDVVSVTSTVNTLFGSGIISETTGILFNNQMDDFSTPGMKNAYDLEPSEANMIRPGQRPVSSLSPTIITDEMGDAKLVVGAAGGPRIISATAWVSMMKLQAGLNVKEAINYPRLHHQLMPMKVVYFPGFDKTVLEYLESIGHQTEELPSGQRGSVVQAVATEADGIVTANYDWRKTGSVSGF